jgi:excisionase family DNA binding protein
MDQTPTGENFPSVMTVAEVAVYVRVPPSTIYEQARRGEIPCHKVGRHWRFHREAIDAWLGKKGL